jgi:hypothetical protein
VTASAGDGDAAQAHSGFCGVAAATVVENHLGCPLDSAVVEALAVRAVTLGAVEMAFTQAGFQCEFVSQRSLSMSEFLHSGEAMILYIPPALSGSEPAGLGHALAVVRANDGSLVVLDPSSAQANRAVTVKEVAAMGWKGEALVISNAAPWWSFESGLMVAAAIVTLFAFGFAAGRLRKHPRNAQG